MKIAFLFSGQLRNLPVDLFRKSLLNLTREIEYDIFAYLWEETGKSLNHSSSKPEIYSSKNSKNYINQMFDGFNTEIIKYESFNYFINNLKPDYREIYESKDYHPGTINSLAQIYTLTECFKLVSIYENQYDLVFKCRFDSLFIHPLNLYNLKKIKSTNKIYNLNFGRAYYPNRIYDIFFGGSYHSMYFLSDMWEKLPELIYDRFDNKLDKRDSCRLFYLAAIKSNFEVCSLDTRICDIFRNFENNYYEQYIISMHLVSLKKILNNLPIFKYINSWCSNRGLSFKKLMFLIVKSIIISPLSFLKRLKYIS